MCALDAGLFTGGLGVLAMHGWWFDLDDGRLWATYPETGAFLPIEPT